MDGGGDGRLRGEGVRQKARCCFVARLNPDDGEVDGAAHRPGPDDVRLEETRERLTREEDAGTVVEIKVVRQEGAVLRLAPDHEVRQRDV